MEGHLFKVSKGAPQVVLDLCLPDADMRKSAEQTVNEFALKGYRALGVAKTDEAGHWVFLGILPLFDPPREDAASTIQEAKAHGVDIKMVTGDNIAIAKQISGELGLGQNILLADQLIQAKIMKILPIMWRNVLSVLMDLRKSFPNINTGWSKIYRPIII